MSLSSCPFCGKQPNLKNGKVKCVNLQCKVQPKIAAWYESGHGDKAAADWNMRSPDMADEITRLKGEAEAWRQRFPQHEYRSQDDCIALKGIA